MGRALALIVAVAVTTLCRIGSADRGDPPELLARRAAHLLEYVASDYPGAVRDGQVVSQPELDEQLQLVDDVTATARELGWRELGADLGRLRRVLERHGSPEQVGSLVATMRGWLLARYRIDLLPPGPPDLAAGRALFRRLCAECHGQAGDADTPKARSLMPPPARLVDPFLAEGLSPRRVGDTALFGIAGTAMVPFRDLSREERWNLGWYVMTLRHTPRPAELAPAFGLEELGASSDGELLDQLFAAGVPEAQLVSTLASVRTAATLRPDDTGLGSARDALAQAAQAIGWGDRPRAAAALARVGAELSGWRRRALASDSELLQERVVELGARLCAGEPADALARDVSVIATYITRSALAAQRRGAAVTAARLVVERGAMAALGTLALLLWWPGRRRAREAGVAAAAALGVATWMAWRADGPALLDWRGAADAATVALVLAAGWRAEVLAAAVAALWLRGAADIGGILLGAVAAGQTTALLGGALAFGLLAAFVAQGRTLPRGLRWTRGVTIGCGALAVAALAGRAVWSLQLGGMLPAHMLPWVGWPTLGVHPTYLGLSIQVGALFATLVIGARLQRQRGRFVARAPGVSSCCEAGSASHGVHPDGKEGETA